MNCILQRLGISFILFSIVLNLGTARSADLTKNIIVFASNEYTTNWNPLSPSSIPAAIVSQLVTEQLLEKRCIAKRKLSNLHFRHFCAHPSTDVSSAGSMRLVLNDEMCGIYRQPLTKKDISFTLKEFGAAKENRYNIYGLRIDGRDRIRISFPLNPPEFLAKNILRFPIIRDYRKDRKNFESGDFALKIFSDNDEKEINSASGGDYSVTMIKPRKVVLERRIPLLAISGLGDSSNVKPTAVKTFVFKYFDRLQDLRESMSQSDTKPDVVLSFPSDKALILPDTVYRKRHHAAAAHVTYLGYNFNSQDRMQLTVLESTEFRNLVSQTLWSMPLVKMIVGVGTNKGSRGIWLGASPDVNAPMVQAAPGERLLRKRIEAFLNRQRLSSTVNMRVVVSPIVVKRQFDVADRQNIGGYLNRFWKNTDFSKGVAFELIDPVGMKDFKDDIEENRFHMVLDSKVFAHPMSYMLFMKPGSQNNELGIKVFSAKEIDNYLSGGGPGKQEFLTKFSKTHPISVIGYFSSRVLLSTRINNRNDCPADAVPYPFYNLKNWVKR